MAALSHAVAVGVFILIFGSQALLGAAAYAAGSRAKRCASAGITHNRTQGSAARCAQQAADTRTYRGFFSRAAGSLIGKLLAFGHILAQSGRIGVIVAIYRGCPAGL